MEHPYIHPRLLERLADDLVQMHNDTGIELQYWENALRFVEHFYKVDVSLTIGEKKR